MFMLPIFKRIPLSFRSGPRYELSCSYSYSYRTENGCFFEFFAEFEK